ncbi:MAG: cytochrome P450 [Gaiellales bacterium]
MTQGARAPVANVDLDDLERDPHSILADLRRRHPAVWVPALDGWMVLTRAAVLAAMRDDAGLTVDDPRFSTGRITGPSMLSTDAPEHVRHRGPFARAFRLDAIRARFAAVADAEAPRLVAEFAARGSADLRAELAGPLAARMMLVALGLDGPDAGDVLDWYARIVDAVTRITAGEDVPADGRDAYRALGDAIRASLAADHDGGTLLASALGDADDLTEDELVANAAVLLFGGVETTDGMISNLLHHLLAEPGLLQRVAADDALAAGAIEESLRLEPAAAVVDRYATRDLAIGDARIRMGDLVVLSMASANRDEAVFADPDRFDPARANARLHTSFATGPHVCLGMHLARLEARAALRALAVLPGLRADPAAPSAPTGLVFRKPPVVRALWDAA